MGKNFIGLRANLAGDFELIAENKFHGNETSVHNFKRIILEKLIVF